MACSCTSSCGCNDVTIPTGATGAQGPQGLYGGFSSDWLFNTTTTSGPASTFLRFNNSTLASVTTIYISKTNADSVSLAGFLALMNTPYGVIKVFKETDSTVFWMGTITAYTDSGTSVALTVTHASSNGTFTASMPIVVTFVPNGATGSQGDPGDAGDAGADGIYGGVSFEYNYSNATTAADPGSGNLKFDNTDLTLASALYISETEDGGTSIANVLTLLDASTSAIKALVKITKKSDSTKFAVYSVGASITDGGTWDTVPLTYLTASGAAPFTNADPVIVSLFLVGDKGDTGATGAAGSTAVDILASEVSAYGDDDTSITSIETLKSYTLSANTLASTGDFVRVKAMYQSAANGNSKTVSLTFGSTTVCSLGGTFNDLTICIEADIVRTGAATQIATWKIWYSNQSSASGISGISDLSAMTETLSSNLDILARAATPDAAGDLSCIQFTVEKYIL